MPRTWHASSGSDARAGRPGAILAILSVGTWLACGPRDARVGSGGPGGGGGGGGAAATTPTFSAEMATNDGVWSVTESLPGAEVHFGTLATGTATHDGQVAVLLFPGAAADPSATAVGAGAGAGIVSVQSFRYGTFRAGVRWPTTCASNEELISAASLRASASPEGDRDANGNGIPDLHQLDIQVPCAAPSFVVMSAWSDYAKDALGRESFRKRSHAVDTATGDVYDTLADAEAAFTKTGRGADLVHVGFPDPTLFYDVGIEWQVNRVRFFTTLDGREVTLWTLTDPAYVPLVPLAVTFQIWHPAIHWLPSAGTTDVPAPPAFEGVFAIDWAAWSSG